MIQPYHAAAARPGEPGAPSLRGLDPVRPAVIEQRIAQVPSTSFSQPRRSLILEADDLGLLHAFNEGVLQARQEGLLSSTCLRANGCAYEHAVHEILPKCPGLGVGIHLCLNEAEPVSPRESVRLLIDSTGGLRGGYGWLIRLARTSSGLRQIECELRAQIERVLGDGVPVDHLNSHQHVHMIPGIFRLTCRLAREYNIPCVRLARELPYTAGGWGKRCQPLTNSNFVKHLLLNYFARINERSARRHGILTVDYFIGVNYTAHMTLATIQSGLAAVPCGSVEVLLHPAVGPDPRDSRYPHRSLRSYVTAPDRSVELQALRLPELKGFLQNEGWCVVSYGSWAKEQGSRRPVDVHPNVPVDIRELCRTAKVPAPVWVSQAQADSRAFAELVITQTPPGRRVLDIGTGSGIIAICLAMSGREVVGVDLSHAAVRTARANARRNGVSFEVYQSDLLSKVRGMFDVIAFNPPYNLCRDTFAVNILKNLVRRVPWVRRQSGMAMPRTVLRFHQEMIARLIRTVPSHLNLGGCLLIHAYESEVDALCDVVPDGSCVELLRHPALEGHTVAMLVRLPPIQPR